MMQTDKCLLISQAIADVIRLSQNHDFRYRCFDYMKVGNCNEIQMKIEAELKNLTVGRKLEDDQPIEPNCKANIGSNRLSLNSGHINQNCHTIKQAALNVNKCTAYSSDILKEISDLPTGENVPQGRSDMVPEQSTRSMDTALITKTLHEDYGSNSLSLNCREEWTQPIIFEENDLKWSSPFLRPSRLLLNPSKPIQENNTFDEKNEVLSGLDAVDDVENALTSAINEINEEEQDNDLIVNILREENDTICLDYKNLNITGGNNAYLDEVNEPYQSPLYMNCGNETIQDSERTLPVDSDYLWPESQNYTETRGSQDRVISREELLFEHNLDDSWTDNIENNEPGNEENSFGIESISPENKSDYFWSQESSQIEECRDKDSHVEMETVNQDFIWSQE